METGLDRIRDHILTKAREEAAAILKAAEAEAKARLDAARARIDQDLKTRIDRAIADLDHRTRQAIDKAAFDHRLDLLKRKREILDTVFNRAKARFLESPAYREWLTRRLAQAGDVTGQVFCRRSDRPAVRAALERLAAEGKKGLTLADAPRPANGARRDAKPADGARRETKETGTVSFFEEGIEKGDSPLGIEKGDSPQGGVIIRSERFDLDLTLDAALADLKGRVMADLIALAFAGVEDTPVREADGGAA